MTVQAPASRRYTLAVYLMLIAGSNAVWEVAQLPLYQIWLEGSFAEQAFAVIHCTIGDVLIAAVSLILAVAIVGRGWPHRRFWATALAASAGGIAYTVFSEWRNVTVLGTWAYRDIMPIVPPFGTGLGPLLEWALLPPAMFGVTYRICRVKTAGT